MGVTNLLNEAMEAKAFGTGPGPSAALRVQHQLFDRPVYGKVREALLKLQTRTMFGDFKVDPDGFQTEHKMVLFQWQDGKKVTVWPDDLASGKPRFPTPPWNQR